MTELNRKTEALAEKHGVSPNSQYAPDGTPMPSGWGNSRRQRWENQNLLTEAANSFSELIEREDRRVTPKKIRDLTIDHSGIMVDYQPGVPISKNAGYTCSLNAWRQLQAYCPDRFKQHKHNFNYWFAYSKDEVRFLNRRKAAHHESDNEPRDLFAVVSKESNRSYQVHWADEALQHMGRHLPKDARCTIDYDYRTLTTSSDITLNAPYEIEESAKVNQLFRVGIRTKNNDRGRGSYEHELIVWRDFCSNGMSIPTMGQRMKTTHRGNTYLERVREMVEVSTDFMDDFSRLWRLANVTHIEDTYDGTTLMTRDIFERLTSHGYVEVDGVEPRTLVERFMTAWEYEPGSSVAAIINAVTRAAHDFDGWETRWASQDLEKQAGALLYNRVYTLPPITGEQRDYFDA